MLRRNAATVLLLVLLWTAPAQAAGPLDSTGSGFPDDTLITNPSERRSFRLWFAAIAEAQYTAQSPEWEHLDCSGLLRFAYVQALSPKTPEWFSRFPFLQAPRERPPAEPSYPLPHISRSVFRIAPGSYEPGDVEAGKLVGMADTRELMQYNSVYLGHSPRAAERGDLMFYRHPLADGSGWHSMVYLGDGMVVYHTGATPEEGGEVRLLSLDALSRHPDPSWHPSPDNPHFLGFFRWRIIS